MVVQFETEADWVLGRRIGSSDVAAVLGRSPFDDASPFAVWERLVLVRRQGSPLPAQDRGHRLEPKVLTAYAERYRVELEVPAPLTTFFRSEHSSSTPDARVPGSRLVEAKTSYSRDGWGPDGTVLEEWTPGVVPAHYFLQVQHQAWVLGADAVDLAALFPALEPFGEHELRVYTVLAHPSVQARIVARLEEFWARHVVGGKPPPIDGSAAASRWLASRWREGRRSATPAETVLAARYAWAKEAAKRWEAERNTLGDLLVGAAGTSKGLDLPGGGYVRVVRNRGRDVVDAEALLEAHPELRPIIEQHTRRTDAFAYPTVRLTRRS